MAPTPPPPHATAPPSHATAPAVGWSRSRRAPTLLVSPLVALAVLLVAPSAQAELKFQSPQTLSAGGQDASAPQVAVDPEDRVTVVWAIAPGVVQAVRLGSDGGVGTVRDLGEGGAPQLAIDTEGRATVAWTQFRPLGPPVVHWVRIGADGVPGEARTLAEGSAPQVAVDLQGRATVVWQADDGFGDERIQAVRIDADGTPGTIHTLSDEGRHAVLPEVAVDRQGRATVVWGGDPQEPHISREKVQVVRLGADGTPGDLHTLSAARAWRARLPQVAVDSKGRATVAWGERADRSRPRRSREVLVRAVRLGPDGEPGAVRTLSKRSPGGPELAVDSKGRVTVVWQRVARATAAIQSIRIGRRGAPGAPATLSRGDAASPRVTVDSKGRATVVWERSWKRAEGIQARRLGAGGAPGDVHTLSRGRVRVSDAQVAFDTNGRPTVVWQRTGGGARTIQFTRGRIRG